MRIFDGKLYVSTGLNYEHGGQIWFTADGDTWQVTQSVLETGDYKKFSFGNYHTDAAYFAIGTGTAMVLRDGLAWETTWSRPSAADGTTFTLEDGSALP